MLSEFLIDKQPGKILCLVLCLLLLLPALALRDGSNSDRSVVRKSIKYVFETKIIKNLNSLVKIHREPKRNH